MEIRATNGLDNLSIAQSRNNNSSSESRPNAFGIGSANQPEVELSPQARILQQNEQTQNERREALSRDRDNGEEDNEQRSSGSGNEFVRVSSSVGSAQKNNLSTEKATEVYQSIQNLL